MFTIQKLNKISDCVSEALPAGGYTLTDSAQSPDAILVRSASMHELPVPESLLAVARAGAGYNNIPVDEYTKRGICVFNTPGANANAVCEMVLAAMLLSCRDIVGGMRASIYNAMPVEGVQKLVDFMKQFETEN